MCTLLCMAKKNKHGPEITYAIHSIQQPEDLCNLLPRIFRFSFGILCNWHINMDWLLPACQGDCSHRCCHRWFYLIVQNQIPLYHGAAGLRLQTHALCLCVVEHWNLILICSKLLQRPRFLPDLHTFQSSIVTAMHPESVAVHAILQDLFGIFSFC